MEIRLAISQTKLSKVVAFFDNLNLPKVIVGLASLLAVGATAVAFKFDWIVAYGDAESHLNIAKRVVSSITPGAAQLGGVWLPLPHILMIPFVYFDPLWRTGIAGSIVSGVAFVVASLFIYKLFFLLTKNKVASFVSFVVFATNPNILYMQATPMTELPLIGFFVLATYYFVEYILDQNRLNALLLAAFFSFCATLTRYDGWFFVMIELAVLIFINLRLKEFWNEVRNHNFKPLGFITPRGEGIFVMFATLACIGILSWFAWCYIILGNALYFTSSQFSANSQQQGWLAKGQLPSYHNIISALSYYTVTSASIAGVLLFLGMIVGLIVFLRSKDWLTKALITLVLLVPFIFYVTTLYAGQSMIFIPHLTPVNFEWRLFNVRYGIVMLPAVAFGCAYLFYKCRPEIKLLLVILFAMQFGLYFIGFSKVEALEDGTVGLSSARRPDAEHWLAKNYDSGLVLMDDYSRIMSIIRSGIPMQNIIYIGNKPYWQESLAAPERIDKWIIIQKGDTVWKAFYETKAKQDKLYTFYKKVYTSEDILIFERK